MNLAELMALYNFLSCGLLFHMFYIIDIKHSMCLTGRSHPNQVGGQQSRQPLPIMVSQVQNGNATWAAAFIKALRGVSGRGSIRYVVCSAMPPFF